MYHKILQLHCQLYSTKLLGIIAGFFQVVVGIVPFLHKGRQLYYQNCMSTREILQTIQPYTFAIVTTEVTSFKSS